MTPFWPRAAYLVPSAELPPPYPSLRAGTLLDLQVSPPLVEVKTFGPGTPDATASNLRPSADDAMEFTLPPRLLNNVQVVPELAEVTMLPTLLPTASRLPSAEETTH